MKIRSSLNLYLMPTLLATLVGFISCKPGAENNTKDCTYSYNNTSSSIKWTAYKLTEKVGVSGGFKTFTATPGKDRGSLEEILTGLQFNINASTVDSGVPDRDKKIAEQFFGTMQENGNITGTIKAASAGQATVSLSMNGQSREVPMTYALAEGNILTAGGEIDAKEFGAQKSLAALNKVCEAQHTGADKQSVLWPDVKIEIKTTLGADCK